MFLIQEAFAGAWALIFHWGAGVALIILCLALAYFSPLYKKYFLYAAGVIALLLVAYGVGIADQHSREKAQQKVIIDHVDEVVKESQDKKNTDHPDRWNNKDY
jgi:hypothetical protein